MRAECRRGARTPGADTGRPRATQLAATRADNAPIVPLANDSRGAAPDDPDTQQLTDQPTAGLALVLPDGRRVVLDGRPLTVGKSRRCTLVINDPAVSAEHCRIVQVGTRWVIRDLDSTNGTVVGTVRVDAAVLSAGASIVVGRTRLICALEGEAPAGENAGECDATPIVGRSVAMLAVREAIGRYAPSAYPVLIRGETGSGKEVVARAIHDGSTRSRGPFVAINAATIPQDLVESELFGHERGAFTGAVGRRRGVFEEADGGTLFLDEIGELPLSQQAKLLRVLETREIRRVGGQGNVEVDVRIVAATHRDLEPGAAHGAFRRDLFYRLDVLRITLPALRERPEDIGPLARHLLGRVQAETGRVRVLDYDAILQLVRYEWPGNVRELFAVLRRAAIEAPTERIGAEHLSFGVDTNVAPSADDPTRPPHPSASPALHSSRTSRPASARTSSLPGANGEPPGIPSEIPNDGLDAPRLRAVLGEFGGNISRAAAFVGLPRTTYRDRLRR